MPNDGIIKLKINVDGLPLFGSSKKSLWPILMQVDGDLRNEVIMVAAYWEGEGTESVTSDEFLTDFVDEVNGLINNGIVIDDRKFEVRVQNFICDAPAKAFILDIKGHTGYSSCHRCSIRGERIGNQTSFRKNPKEETPVNRTAADFLNVVDPDHHRKRNNEETLSPIANIIDFDVILGFPFDYMHLMSLGITKKVLDYWVNGLPKTAVNKGSSKVKMTSDDIKTANTVLLRIKPFTPVEFQRRCRNIDEFAFWKATEFRQFLIYTGPIVLSQIFFPHDTLRWKMYQNFLKFHKIGRLLLGCENVETNAVEAQKMISKFLKEFEKIYGGDLISHNFHSLTHLPEDVLRYGPADNFCCFQFESFLQKVKGFVKQGNLPLQQVVLKYKDQRLAAVNLTRNEDIEFFKRHSVDRFAKLFISDSDLSHYELYEKLKTKEFTIKTKPKNPIFQKREMRNSFVISRNDDICVVLEIIKSLKSNDVFLVLGKFEKKERFLKNYFKVEMAHFNERKPMLFPLNCIKSKLFAMPLTDDEETFATIPISHICRFAAPE
ncbi:uncharacterized protein LOC135846700 [Planococcus citri]|uniref:uncharacterized protein LOC135846700 n=1 Tax=Planococcus citri TaxID=170843 RepID=UPI0031F7B9EB